ncbi:Hypothetical predicted protein, partial [Paramuricea clavata]
EIELQKLQLESQNKSSDHSTPYFDVTKHIRMVPPFQEREVDKYFLHFEKVAKNCNWPKESWTMLLQSVLLGKAREIFSQLTVEDSGEYDTVKRLILKGYELVPEAYRQKFHILGKSSNKTFVEFAQEKAQLFDRWCTSENVENKYDRLPNQLKAMLQRAPVLSAPDFSRPFKLAVDASDIAAGAVLLQEDDDGIDHPVAYFSRKFNHHQRNYSTVEKECLALILALQHFDVYVSSAGVPIEVFSDHNPLVFIHRMKDKNQRLLRWSLILSEYN